MEHEKLMRVSPLAPKGLILHSAIDRRDSRKPSFNFLRAQRGKEVHPDFGFLD